MAEKQKQADGQKSVEDQVKELAEKHGMTKPQFDAAMQHFETMSKAQMGAGPVGARDWSGFLAFLMELVKVIGPFIPH